ncbi:hypothetical protein MUK42_21246 [Musa troglodytarum]|uniref:Uncharacterized protein n=1 Tax=Musa troglodytarum TaxID=320322 RepID=A0A9E7FVQ1_9LILI|nr:hypothetical protein MUK42_21246 [Musa troglodytarum]
MHRGGVTEDFPFIGSKVGELPLCVCGTQRKSCAQESRRSVSVLDGYLGEGLYESRNMLRTKFACLWA